VGKGNPHLVEPLISCRITPVDPVVVDLAATVAAAHHRPFRPLHLQALIQLPRVASSHGFIPVNVARCMLDELAVELPESSEWSVFDGLVDLRSLSFGSVDQMTAEYIMNRFHYLRSARRDGRCYGLRSTSGETCVLSATSPLDVPHLCRLLEAGGIQTDAARVVSRVFCFPGTPPNAISHMLALIAREERQAGATDLVTYVNPNLGFRGDSYLASGWRILGSEPLPGYRYLDGRYVTDRVLSALFGSRDDDGYRQLLGRRFSVSTMPLQPLLVFHRNLRQGRQLRQGAQVEVARSANLAEH